MSDPTLSKKQRLSKIIIPGRNDVNDPTVELSVKEDAEWRAERAEEIAAICWEKCPNCNGRGFTVEHLEGDPDEYILKETCPRCNGKREIQIHDPWRVEALFDAADDARRELGVWCYIRIAKALSLAIEGAVDLNGTVDDVTVASATTEGKVYLISHKGGCNCFDAYYRAPKIEGWPACKHQIAVWLVQKAKKLMYDTEAPRGPMSDCLDGLVSYEEVVRREERGSR